MERNQTIAAALFNCTILNMEYQFSKYGKFTIELKEKSDSEKKSVLLDITQHSHPLFFFLLPFPPVLLKRIRHVKI